MNKMHKKKNKKNAKKVKKIVRKKINQPITMERKAIIGFALILKKIIN